MNFFALWPSIIICILHLQTSMSETMVSYSVMEKHAIKDATFRCSHEFPFINSVLIHIANSNRFIWSTYSWPFKTNYIEIHDSETGIDPQRIWSNNMAAFHSAPLSTLQSNIEHRTSTIYMNIMNIENTISDTGAVLKDHAFSNDHTGCGTPNQMSLSVTRGS